MSKNKQKHIHTKLFFTKEMHLLYVNMFSYWLIIMHNYN